MTDRSDFDAVVRQLGRAPRPPEAGRWSGASSGQLALLDRSLPAVPASLRTWLRVCNGDFAGPGGLYGIDVEPVLDIRSVLEMHPHWREQGWIPVAGDGTGNQYVIDATGRHLPSDEAVYFVDVAEDAGALAYVVASALRPFLVFLLNKELGERRWPFDKGYVLSVDPAIGGVQPETLLPWNA